ncbi:hypothetical protein D3C87_109540 [compost metagenome]
MGNKLLHNSQVDNSRGFTIMEILVVLGLSSILLLTNASFLREFLENMKKVETESMEEIEMAITNRRFTKILSYATPGFNRLEVLDVNGRNFYDYFPDMPRESFGEAEGAREVRLSLDGGQKALYLLSSEEQRYPGVSLDPFHAYRIGNTPTDMNADGTVIYNGLNSTPAVPSDKRIMTQVYGNRWADDELFLLMSPVYLRPLTNGGTIDLKTPPRTPTFVGRVKQNDLLALTSNDFRILNTHPLTRVPYSNADMYFRTLPPVGGAAPFVKVEAVRVYRLEFRPGPYPAGYGDLVMSEWRNGTFGNDDTVVRKARQVRFVRETVTMPLITLEVDK